MQKNAKLVFWGVRGSTPTLERDSWRYGGNTPCLELTTADGVRLILDCGTGLRMLGNSLRTVNHRWGEGPGEFGIDAHVLVTHYHWDHIQGIPFFHPFFEAQNRFHFYSFQSKYLGRNSLRQVLEAQLASPYFPVDVSNLRASRSFREVAGGDEWDITGTHVTAAWLNHPQDCLAYRFDMPVGSVVYATDTEPGVREKDHSIRELAHGADVLIYDAQYSPEQLASSRKGWGHSSWLEGVKIARESKVRNLVLFHHDPDSTSRVIDGFLSAARQEFPASWAAMEGMSMTLSERGVAVALPKSRLGQRRRLRFAATVKGETEDGRPFEERAMVRDLSLHGAYLCLNSRPRLQSELSVAIDASAEHESSLLSLRATVVHCDPGRERSQNGVGVVFVEDAESEMPRD
ncbi:MAG: PilZ domain-containing protein [Acidobacteriota bacterium]|nr:PilZ domain-containing protein [Acidobacteriota bacterium]